MNHRMNFMAAVACVAVLTGCDWGGVDSDEAWNDSYSWLNFSGTYTLSDVGLIRPGTPKDQQDETPGDKPGSKVLSASYKGALTQGPGQTKFSAAIGTVGAGIVPGTVALTLKGEKKGHFSFTDDGNKALLDASGTGRGYIDYSTGAWSIEFKNVPFNLGGKVTWTADYRYQVGDPGAGDPNKGGATIGGASITFLHVSQKGNLLSMSDSRGVSFSGRITGASTSKDGYVNPSDVRVSFEVSSNRGEKIVGHFSGIWSGGEPGASGVLSDRHLTATFSSNGGHDDIQGAASAVSLTAPYVVAPSSGGEGD